MMSQKLIELCASDKARNGLFEVLQSAWGAKVSDIPMYRSNRDRSKLESSDQ